MKPSGLMTKKEAATWLRASERTVQRRVDKGELRRIKEGGRVFFLESDLIDYLARTIEKSASR